jgi:hypothetical protein
MSNAALRLPENHAPANDNVGLRYDGPDTEGDRWVWLIEKFKTIHMPLAVVAAQERLRGVKVDVFCAEFIAAGRLAGWECLQPGARFGDLY